MDTQRAFLAIALSFIILVGYQYLFVGPPPEQPQQTEDVSPQATAPPTQPQKPVATTLPPPSAKTPAPSLLATSPQPTREGRDIMVDSNLYSAIVTETGGGIKSFKLKDYNETTSPDSDLVELIRTEIFTELPLYFTWGVGPEYDEIPVYSADREKVTPTEKNQLETLTLQAQLASGLHITRTMIFDVENYLFNMVVNVKNTTAQPLQGAPHVSITNRPFAASSSASKFLFSGPALLVNNQLQEIKPDDLEKEPTKITGKINWVAYEGTYFMTGILPKEMEELTTKLSADGDKVSTVIAGKTEILPAQGSKQYQYSLYFGPKKISVLKEVDAGLDRIVNFGWFDKLARPTLVLLNFIHQYSKNYGVAIILVTVLIKILFWPIAQKGMKSMRNMQKIQPKITKLREKYKNDATRMNQEMMGLYKTYKINPLGGCLPMLLQIPVFFALYKVLLQAIELRHAPFMLWITDLSAPDRLWAGLNLPYLGGIPVLTLLMGGSMFLQQKLTPSPADPTQAKIMMFLPVIFTFMFLNFASGLVLYWFVNNLLSIGQQYVINKAKD